MLTLPPAILSMGENLWNRLSSYLDGEQAATDEIMTKEDYLCMLR